MGRSLRIGSDVDGVLFEIVAPMVEFLDSIGISVPSYEETYDYDLAKVWGCSRTEMGRRINLFYKSEYFPKLRPMPGVQQALGILVPAHNAYPITARPLDIEHLTKAAFDKHLPGKFDYSYHLGHFDGSGPKVTKVDIARSLPLDGRPLDFVIEDSLFEAEAIARANIQVVLITHPWNCDRAISTGITRVNGWMPDIVDYVKKYE